VGGDYDHRKPAVHERLLNNEQKSLRSYFRKNRDKQPSNSLCLENVKQNVIKFVCSEHEYSQFVSHNGVLLVNPAGSTFLDQFRK